MHRNGLILTGAACVLALALASCVTQGVKMGTERETSKASNPQAGSAIAGSWEGEIAVGGRSIPIEVQFAGQQAAVTATIDIPSQAVRGLALESVALHGDRVVLTLAAGSDRATFDGVMKGDTITGSFRQGPAEGTFRLSRGKLRSDSGGGALGTATEFGTAIDLTTATGTIHGSLVLPNGTGPFPVALIISGSGPTDRNGNSPLIQGKNNSLELIARALARVGIASVRYDKRGVGASAAALKSEKDIRFSDYVDDAAAWIEKLKKDQRLSTVAVIGHSEGSLIGMVAANLAGADAFVSIAGPGRPADEILKEQLANQPGAIRTKADSFIDSLKAGHQVENVPPDLMALFRPSVQPYLISWFRYDPRSEIARLAIPVLILQGTTDLQVSVKDAELLHAAQPRSTLRIISGMNHILKTAPADPQANLATYGNPDLPLAPQLVAALTDFLTSVLRR